MSWWLISTGCATSRPDPKPIFTAAVQAHSDRQFAAAATGYERILRQYSDHENLCAQALRSLGNVRAAQGQTNEAVKLYARVAEKYPRQNWEVLQAWKSAGDLLWEAGRQDEAREFYRRIVGRFDQPDRAPVVVLIVRAARAKLPGAQ